MAFAVAMFVICVFMVGLTSGQWVNKFDGDAKLECVNDQVMSFFGSVHSSYYEDRKWQFQCKPAPDKVTDCYWTDFVNNFDEQFLFLCPGNEILNGMYSFHYNRDEDRRFMMKCCKVSKKLTRNSNFTDFINDFDGEMHFNIPDDKYLKGVYSYHDNSKEDRRWKLNLCDLV